MKKVFKVEDLDCANCAAKLEYALSKLDGVNKATVNFLTQKIIVEVNDDNSKAILDLVKEVSLKTLPDIKIYD